MSNRKNWAVLTSAERRERILKRLRSGATISALASYLDAPPGALAIMLDELRTTDDRVKCTNKIWWRNDVPVEPPKPREPYISEKKAKFLARQGKLF